MAKLIKVWDGSAWQEVAVSASLPSDFNVVLSGNSTLLTGRSYFVDTTAARTLTLPASASAGDTISIFDATGTASTYNITVNVNGGKINGVEGNLIIDTNGYWATLVYTGSTYGWKVG